MTFIAIVFTVCALAKPEKCEEQRLDYVAEGSLLQCVMSAQPYLAQWIGEHPKWSIKSYHCEYPHMKERTDARGSGAPNVTHFSTRLVRARLGSSI